MEERLQKEERGRRNFIVHKYWYSAVLVKGSNVIPMFMVVSGEKV
jgi:hypothetical protein